VVVIVDECLESDAPKIRGWLLPRQKELLYEVRREREDIEIVCCNREIGFVGRRRRLI
jgi:hypothetical protein